MNKIYTCRWCHKQFEAKPEEKNITWIERSNNWYYHKKCYDDFTDMTQDKTSESWLDLTFDLLKRKLNVSYNYHMIKAQAEKMVNNNIATMKGIYYTLYWYYVIQGNMYQEKYGIGIVPSIYDKSMQYWLEREEKTQGIMKQIAELQKIEKAAATQTVKPRQKKKRKITSEPDFL